MKEQDLQQLWREIAADLDQDEDIDLDQYLQQKGINHKPVDSLNKQVQHLIEDTFTVSELTEEQLQSKYKITQQIDSGGQSDIYLAERSDGVYQQTVVIKFIAERFDQTALKQQFLQEMQLLADLRHPGVVTIIDGNITDEGQPWLVLEYIDGPHIDQYCQQQQLDTQEVVGLMMNLCETLQFVHRREVLHKDLKPSNVLVKLINGVPFPVLIDFGIAMIADDQVELNYGTLGFSAPEQVAGERVDQRSDLYALGMMFGYLLLQSKGQTIEINDAMAIHKALKISHVSNDLQKVILKLTEPEKNNRYQSADALRSDLNQWQLGFPLSFDSHRISAVFKKIIKRHPWVTVALLVVLGSAVFFTAKYTRDVQQLQQLTVAEKNATDELMNFMLDDLYENLERIGRIDVLQSVAEKSVAHLGAQDPQTLDQAGHFQSAKAYMNTGRVYDYLEQAVTAQEMFSAAEKHLKLAQDGQANSAEYYALLAKLRVYESQVLQSAGQEQANEKVLLEAIDAMQHLQQNETDFDLQTLWEARLELSYHLMEYAQEERAREQINQTLELAKAQLAIDPKDADWLHANSQSLQLKAWFELDFGELNQGIKDTVAAIEFAEDSIDQDPEDIKKQHNQRILFNQMAFFHLEAGDKEAAKKAVLTAIKLGNNLTLKAPFNQEFEREQAYSYSTAGEVFQSEGDLIVALMYFQQGLDISQKNYEKDPHNYSVANDLAVDSLLVADLLQQAKQQVAAESLFIRVDKLMTPVHLAEPNNKYYAHTLLVTKLQLKQFEAAKRLFDLAVENDVVDTVVENLLAENELNWLP